MLFIPTVSNTTSINERISNVNANIAESTYVLLGVYKYLKKNYS